MDNCRLQARDWLSRSTRKEFEANNPGSQVNATADGNY